MIHFSGKPEILIVDDVQENLLALEKVLRRLDVAIVTAESGNEALKATLHHDFSLILLDVMMPDMNGYEVAELIKENEKTANIPIIFITAMEKNESQEIRGYSKGAVDFIFKPFSDFVLLSKVKVLLELFRMKRSIELAMLKQISGMPSVLIVDDNPENLFALEKLLRKLDVDIVKANSGNEALACTIGRSFALIILDVQMPGMDGYEVAELLKSDDRTANIPIIFVTAIDRDEAKELKGYDRGAVDFIFKPYNEYILISKVKIFLEIYKMKIGLEELVAERTNELQMINEKLKMEIAEKEKAQSELMESRSYLKNVIDSISSAIIGVNPDGRITNLNRAAQKLSGVSPEAALGKSIDDIFPCYNGFTDEVMRAIKRKEEFEKLKEPVYIRETLFMNNFFAYPLLVSGEIRGAVIRIDDVTEQFRIEEMMIQSEKMLSVGGLAAGMAHEINNPLGGILQNAQVIRNRFSGDLAKNREAARACGTDIDTIEAYIEKRGISSMIDSIMESGIRAATIVENTLSFSRKSQSAPAPHRLDALLDKTLELAASDYDLKKEYDFRNIEIVRDYNRDIPEVVCEGSQIQQVFLNVFRNGAEAMAETPVGEGARFIVRLKRENDMAVVEIEDNGPGMDSETCQRVFEPFFTTKSAGTGLGLSISSFIITQKHGGTIDVESRPGRGANFIIRLPFKRE